jgi:hypothetical protein
MMNAATEFASLGAGSLYVYDVVTDTIHYGSQQWIGNPEFRRDDAANLTVASFVSKYTDGMANGPLIDFRREIPTPAVNNVLAMTRWTGSADDQSIVQYAGLRAQIIDPRNTSISGRLAGLTVINGTLTEIIRIDANLTANGIAQGSGLKHQLLAIAPIAAGTTALLTLTWSTPFADANYTVTASVISNASPALTVTHIQSISATNVLVRVRNDAASTIGGTLHVIALRQTPYTAPP